MKKFECKNINCFAKCTLLVENEKKLAKQKTLNNYKKEK